MQNLFKTHISHGHGFCLSLNSNPFLFPYLFPLVSVMRCWSFEPWPICRVTIQGRKADHPVLLIMSGKRSLDGGVERSARQVPCNCLWRYPRTIRKSILTPRCFLRVVYRHRSLHTCSTISLNCSALEETRPIPTTFSWETTSTEDTTPSRPSPSSSL